MRAALGVLVGIVVGGVLPAGAVSSPAGVASIHGNRWSGFSIAYADGSQTRTPPIGAVFRECRDGRDTEGESAYVRCMTSVRVQYAAYGLLRDTLEAKGVNR